MTAQGRAGFTVSERRAIRLRLEHLGGDVRGAARRVRWGAVVPDPVGSRNEGEAPGAAQASTAPAAPRCIRRERRRPPRRDGADL